MKSKFSKVILAGGVLGLCLTTSVTAATIKDLQGAWTMNGTKCEDTFKKVGKTVEFKDRTASTSTGFLIRVIKVSGPNAVFSTKSVKKQ